MQLHNDGNVALRNLSIILGATPLNCAPEYALTWLAPGELVSCSGSYNITAEDSSRGLVANNVTVEANSGLFDAPTALIKALPLADVSIAAPTPNLELLFHTASCFAYSGARQ